jgi:hypothetical protein
MFFIFDLFIGWFLVLLKLYIRNHDAVATAVEGGFSSISVHFASGGSSVIQFG